jgi:hypothetical protein
MLKVTLLIIVFLTDNRQTTLIRQVDSMEQCKTAVVEIQKEMEKIPEVQDAVFLCSNRIAPTGVESGVIET